MKKFTEKINESVEDKILNTEQFIEDYLGVDSDFIESMRNQMSNLSGFDFENVPDLMIEFAKYHVKNAVKEQIRIENDRISDESELDRLTEEALKRTYPLENIK